ncbi:class I tRNA ligase family protein [Saccharothrix lopnurensis]|uniref:Class I tRNA ligase family protein n=1 Tax=Saccharothrix lopnurensis TaxID=1670621 RepID=A0ABW1P7U9_9PSEU
MRRSRQRFWEGDQDALATLYETLDVLTRLLAPIVPFITEEVWQRVVRPRQPGGGRLGAPGPLAGIGRGAGRPGPARGGRDRARGGRGRPRGPQGVRHPGAPATGPARWSACRRAPR